MLFSLPSSATRREPSERRDICKTIFEDLVSVTFHVTGLFVMEMQH